MSFVPVSAEQKRGLSKPILFPTHATMESLHYMDNDDDVHDDDNGPRSSVMSEISHHFARPVDCDIASYGRILIVPSMTGACVPEAQVRQKVLLETLIYLGTQAQRDALRAISLRNLDNAAHSVTPNPFGKKIHVLCGDWGQVTESLTFSRGKLFAVLTDCRKIPFWKMPLRRALRRV